jgi:hypothetical protein
MADETETGRTRRAGRGRHIRGRHSPGALAHSSRNRTWLFALVSTVLVLGIAGVSLALTARTKSAGRADTPPGTSSTTTPASSSACPLSGVPAAGGQVPRRPALAIKVDNYPSARPQSGLDKADIVFEEPVEGGITRLVAVFQCQSANLVGPIRSARAVDASILDQLSKPLFLHVGGITPVLSLIREADVFDETLLARGSVVQNPPNRYAPDDTYVSTAAGWGLRPNDTAPPASIFTYSSTAPSGTPVTSLHIPYSQTSDVTWTWDANTGRWTLYYAGTPATVANGGQIAVPNVVVQTVRVTYGPWVEDAQGRLEVQSQLTGSGPLEVFRNGQEVTGTWQRSSLSQPTRLVASDGSMIALQPGETWVELVPSSIAVTTTAPSRAAG